MHPKDQESNINAPHVGEGLPYFGMHFRQGEDSTYISAKSFEEMSRKLKEKELDLTQLIAVEFIDSGDIPSSIMNGVCERMIREGRQHEMFGSPDNFSTMRDHLITLNNDPEFALRCSVAASTGLGNREDLESLYRQAYNPDIILLPTKMDDSEREKASELVGDPTNRVVSLDAAGFHGAVVINGLQKPKQSMSNRQAL